MVSTLQSYIYEDLHPKIEKKDTPESKLLIVHIPDGFTRGDIGAKVEYDFGRIRVFGERSIGSNKMIRFNEKYQVPSHCDIGNIKGKFDGKIVTITMPKIPGKIAEPEQEPIEENNNNNNNMEEVKDQQNTSNQDPKSNVESKEDQTPQEEAQKDQEEISQKESATQIGQEEISHLESVTQIGQEKISQKDSIPQKGQEEISQNESAPKMDREEISQQEKEYAPQKYQAEIYKKESIPPKGREEISEKSKFESKGEASDEISTPSEVTHESKPQKEQNQETLNKATDTKDAKLQTEEDTTKKTKEESKGSATEETLPPKKTYIEKGKQMINDTFGDDIEKKSDKKGIHESARTRIKDMALSTTQAVTNYAKRFNDEDKQKLIYTGATILVVALGVYASYKYRSSRRS